MPGQTLTEVAVEIYPDVKRLKPAAVAAGRDAGESAGEAMGDGITRGADGKLRDSRGKFVASGKKSGADFAKGVQGGFGDTFIKVASVMAAKFALIGGAAAASAPGVLQLAGALAPAVGAATALPAALLSIKAVSATTKLAVMGVGDAIQAGFGDNPKDAKKALDQLSGSARVFAGQIIGLQKPLKDIQQSVSDRFFRPLINDVQPLAEAYIPLLKEEMSDLAGRIGGFAEQTAKAAKQGVVMQAVRSVFDTTGQSVVALREAISPLAAAFANLILSTAPELPKLADGFVNVAQKVSGLITEAAKSGAITTAFQNGKQVLSDLGGIISNVGVILLSVYRAANQGGNTLLGNLRDLTGQAAEFLQKASGFGALTAIFGTLGSISTALRTGLGAVLPAIAESIQALGPAIAGLAGPASQLVVAIAPLLPIVAGLTAQIVTALTPAIAALAKFLAQNETAVKAIVVALTAYAVALKVTAAVATVQAAGGILAWAKATTIATNVSKIATVAQYAFGAALRFATGPIGLIITGIGLLVAAIVYLWKNNETFRKVVMAVWSAVQRAIKATVDWIVNTAWPWLQRAWEGIANGAKWMWEKVIQPVVKAIVWYFQNVWAPVAQWLYKNVLMPVFNGIARVVKAAIAVAQLAIAVAVAYWKTVLAPTAMWLWKNVIQPVFNGIAAVVRTQIAIVRTILSGIVSFIRTVVATAFTWWWKNIVTPVFNGVRSVISTVWEKGIKPVFNALKGFITNTLPGAFKTGVGAITSAWQKVQEAARKPVEFVVTKVINPLIGGFNKAATIFGTDKIDPIAGFDTGGQIPGRPSHRDNMLAAVANTGRLFKVASGEFITNTASTLANLPLLRTINRKKGKVTRDDIDPVLDGYRKGGRVGDGNGIGDFLGSVYRGIKGTGNAILHPGETLSKIANATLEKIPGGGSFRTALINVSRKVIDGVKKFLSKFADGGGLGTGSIAGGWRGMQRLISARFPNLGLISGFRPGSVTLTGNRSYHALGRAVDYPAFRPLAAWIKSMFGARTKELITPWQELNLHNGRPHTYTGAVWNQHNFAGGNAHVHWAAENGGLVGPRSGIAQIARADFGSVTLQRGWNLIQNATGKPEPLATPDDRIAQLLEAILGAVEANPRQFASAMGGTTAGLLRDARRR